MKKKMVNGKYLLSLMYVVVFSLLSTSLSYAQGVTIGNGVFFNIGNGTLNVPYDIINNGELMVRTGTINVGGNWFNSGTFMSGKGTVNFIDGQSPVSIAGSCLFYNLSVTTGTGKQLDFEAATTQAVTHSLTLQGTSGNLLLLGSTTETVHAMIDLQSRGTQLINYVDVRDHWAIGQTLTAYDSIDRGNNTQWQIYSTDTDGDGLQDSWEIDNFGDLTTADNTTDFDGDGLLDIDEYFYNTDPKDTDTDNDGMPDGWEVTYGLDPLVDDSADDPDGDDITNLDEYINGTDPHGADITTINVSVNPTSASADTTTGFTFQTQAATSGGSVQFKLFNDFNNNDIIDVDEWPVLNMVLADNGQGWINEGLTPDSNPSSPDITTVLSASGCNNINYLPVGNLIIQVKNALGETDTAQFSITPAFASQTVTGTVYEEETTTPVPNALVEYNNSAGVLSLSFTDSSGAYVLQIPTTGSGEICVEKDGYGENCLGLTAPAEAVSNYDLFLTPATTQITGTVTESGTGDPVWGAEVWAEQASDYENETSTITDVNGNYTLPVLPGVVFIGADKYGYMETENNLTVPAGGVSNYNISLTPATTQITGTVTEFGTGNPVCGAEVEVKTSEGYSWNETDVDGSFILPVLSEEVQICVEKEGYMTSCNTLTVPESGISNYSASLTPMDAEITGTVTEFGTGYPIPGGELAANTIEWIWVNTISDNNGNYIIPVLSGVEWNVNLYRVPGYFGMEPQHIHITPTVPGPNIVNFTAHKETAWIEGTLLDEYGDKAVEGAFYYCNRTNPTPSLFSFGITDSAGHVTVGLEAGDWFDGVSTNNTPVLLVDGIPREMVRQSGQVISNITTGDHRAVTSNMYYADGAVEGRVFRQDGVTPAPAGVLVEAYTQNALNGQGQTSVGFISESTNTDANGFYRLPLLGGTWDIQANMWDWNKQSATQQVALATNGNDVIDQPGETITGIDFVLSLESP